MSAIKYEERYAAHPGDVKGYGTLRLREQFLIGTVFKAGEIILT
mgnify:CR=1 FL=1